VLTIAKLKRWSINYYVEAVGAYIGAAYRRRSYGRPSRHRTPWP
jgi:hypothetical protein